MNLFGKIKFTAYKKAPEIMLIAGIGCIVASTIGFIKQTPKAVEILKKREEDLEAVDILINDKELAKEHHYDIVNDPPKDRLRINTQAGFKLVKTYIVPAALQAGGIFLVCKSHSILKGRHVATAAALASVMKEFNDYRKRVVDRFDEQTDKELRYDIQKEQIEEKVVDENGKEKTVKKKEPVVHTEAGEYTYFFDSASNLFSKDPAINKMTLIGAQKEFNRRLIKDKVVFLNDILKFLDLPTTQAGQVVGWRYNLENPTGDNYISFGLENPYSETTRRFMNGYEAVALLDFNCDGYLLDGCLDGILRTK